LVTNGLRILGVPKCFQKISTHFLAETLYQDVAKPLKKATTVIVAFFL
jgi:hypothetical protein